MDQGYSFQQVFEEECKHLEQLHREAGPAGAGFARDQLMGLALSGGGIRSATFNLGVLQALAEARLLEQFDYLSTVSGGGYIGSWLSAWINRRDEANRAQEQAQSEQPGAQVEHKPGVTSVQQELGSSLDRDEEPAPVRFLRSYSNYLTPKTGLLSTDTLAAVATYLRNFMLNVAILVACLVAVLLLPRVAASIGSVLRDAPCAALLIGVMALAFAIWFIELNLATQLPQSTRRAAWYAKRKAILLFIVVPLVVAGLALSYWLIRAENQAWVTGARTAKWFALVLVAGTASIALFWIAALRVAHVERIQYDRPNWGWRLLGLVTGIAVGLAALMCLQKMFGDSVDSGLWHATVSGLPALFGVFGLGAVFVIGTSGRQFEEDSREWWSRLGGVLIGVALIWFLVAAAAIYAPWGVMQLPHVMQGLSLGWLATTLAGLQAARSGSTGAPGSSTWLDLLARVAPYVFIAGLLVALACGIHALLAAGAVDASAPAAWSMADWAVYAPAAAAWLIGPRQWLLFAAAMVITAFLSWRVDVNVFSFHMFYRNRLIRCYLGASNPRRAPQSFTGFDRSDSPNLKDLVQRPYHLINTALNITKGDRLAWQERKAASFVLSPLFCGYEIDNADGGTIHGYQPTSQYVAQARGSLGLGTALAISGAAASPNMGYHSTPAAAFLMTVFNLRLGWWMQNPARPQQWQREGPRWGFLYLLSELLGAANEQSKFVYLSDGGHFDNLGIYELVRRRCRFIVVVDAGCDTGFEFEDLGNAIRKCKIDMGVSIDIDARAIVPTDGRSRLHCAVGTIHYERLGSEAVEGYLLYIKPSLTGNEPADVLQYAKAHPTFPHEPTSDQWFAESQFESYRTLGQHIARTVFDGANVLASQEREAVFVALRERWYPASGAVKQWFSRHADQLKRLQTQLRSDEQLRFLDAQIYPEWDRLMAGRTEAYPSDLSLPRTAAEARAGFYFCASLLDLMEAIYVDLDLEEQYGHPDNRGWMNLFRHWSWSSMFRVTYAICCASHGGRFERFCERRLDLSRGEVRIETMDRAEALDAFLTVQEHAGRLNFVETGLIRQYAAEGVRFDKIVLLRLRVADPSKPAPPAVAALEFTFGFALVDGRGIVYLRVQDHLRRMSLAREALRKMARSGYTEISKDARGDDAEAVRRFRLLHNSVLRELQTG